MKKYKDIIWAAEGWTVIQDADADKHELEISCFTKDGKVTEVRIRHNDGEEEKLTKKAGGIDLPAAAADFRAALEAGKLLFK